MSLKIFDVNVRPSQFSPSFQSRPFFIRNTYFVLLLEHLKYILIFQFRICIVYNYIILQTVCSPVIFKLCPTKVKCREENLVFNSLFELALKLILNDNFFRSSLATERSTCSANRCRLPTTRPGTTFSRRPQISSETRVELTIHYFNQQFHIILIGSTYLFLSENRKF